MQLICDDVWVNGYTWMEDFVSIITSFTARLYGHRCLHRRTEKLIAELKKYNG